MTPWHGVNDGSSAPAQKIPFSLESSSCLHYAKDPVWRRGDGLNYSGYRTFLPVQVCGTCDQPLEPALTQRQREDAALVEQVRQQIAQEILDWKPLHMTRRKVADMSPLEVIEVAKEILSRVAWWPPTHETRKK